MKIKGNKVNLREINEKDLEFVRQLRNKNRKYFYNQNIITTDEQKNWFKKYLSKEDDMFFIIELFDGTSVGTIALYNIDKRNLQAELGRVMIDEKFLGKGYAKDAVLTLIRFGQNELNLYRIYLTTFSDNERAIKLYEKCGFGVEGILKDAIKRNGKMCAITLMSILKK